jgi:hypothetical protein
MDHGSEDRKYHYWIKNIPDSKFGIWNQPIVEIVPKNDPSIPSK